MGDSLTFFPHAGGIGREIGRNNGSTARGCKLGEWIFDQPSASYHDSHLHDGLHVEFFIRCTDGTPVLHRFHEDHAAGVVWD